MALVQKRNTKKTVAMLAALVGVVVIGVVFLQLQKRSLNPTTPVATPGSAQDPSITTDFSDGFYSSDQYRQLRDFSASQPAPIIVDGNVNATPTVTTTPTRGNTNPFFRGE